MYFRSAILAFFAVIVFVFGTGCRPDKTATALAVPPTILSPDTAACVHWLGKRRLGYEATAFFFIRVWNLAQTPQLERQTINRLTTVPERLMPGGSKLAGMSALASSLMLPVAYDLEQEESYLEVRSVTNAQTSTVLAIRLVDDGQAGRWFTNLVNVLEPLTGVRAIAHPQIQGWSIQTTNIFIQLDRVGDWTVVSVGPPKNSLAEEIIARIQRDGVPFVSAGTNLWLEADLDIPRLCSSLSAYRMGGEDGQRPGEVGSLFPPSINSQLSTLNHFVFSLSGDGANVITRAKLTFSQPLPASLEPWKLPVELMHEPLTSFTAVRGLKPWLADWPVWRHLQLSTAPDQIFLWSLSGSPYQVYLAAPLPDASSQMASLTGHLLQKGNPWLATNGYISFDRAADGNGVTWGNLPDIKPFIRSTGSDTDGWLLAGLFPDTNNAAAPPPAGLIQDVLRRTNVVYYDWEVTGPRLQPTLQLAQTARMIARQPQLPLDCASLNWLGAVIPRLGTSATIINRTGLAELTLYRRSTLGLTALELQLLTGWLESPQFPR